MPLKKLLKDLEQALQIEKEIHPKTKLGEWLHKFIMYSMQSRITDIKKELNTRKNHKSNQDYK